MTGQAASAPRATTASPTTSRRRKGAIGYVEFAYAEQNKLTYADMANKAGKIVSPTMDAFQAAAANADWAHAPGFYLILANQPGDKSWPMTAATFILLPKDPPNKAAAKDAIDFFKWAYEKGDKMAEDLDYIPMPDNVVGAGREDVGVRHQAEISFSGPTSGDASHEGASPRPNASKSKAEDPR